MVEVSFSDEAFKVANDLYDATGDPTYDRLQDVLDRIAEDPEEAKYAPWTDYVSSRRLYGTKIPGGDWTVFWKVNEDGVLVVLLVQDMGL